MENTPGFQPEAEHVEQFETEKKHWRWLFYFVTFVCLPIATFLLTKFVTLRRYYWSHDHWGQLLPMIPLPAARQESGLAAALTYKGKKDFGPLSCLPQDPGDPSVAGSGPRRMDVHKAAQRLGVTSPQLHCMLAEGLSPMPSLVLPRLYLGNAASAASVSTLRRLKVTIAIKSPINSI